MILEASWWLRLTLMISFLAPARAMLMPNTRLQMSTTVTPPRIGQKTRTKTRDAVTAPGQKFGPLEFLQVSLWAYLGYLCRLAIQDSYTAIALLLLSVHVTVWLFCAC
jgi:hypothetical protein